MTALLPTVLPRECVIVCQGDSLTYGTDFTRTGTRGGINGERARRSASPYPETLEKLLHSRGWTGVRVVNRGHGDDTAAEGLRRWSGAKSGDLTVLLYGSNDVLRLFAGRGWLQRYEAALSELVHKAKRGDSVLLLELPPARFPTYRTRFKAANEVLRGVARREGVPTLDLPPAFKGLDKVWVDGVHFTPRANWAMAGRVADVLAPSTTSSARATP